MAASIAPNYAAPFSKIIDLHFCQDLTKIKPDLRQSDTSTSQAM
jgi:hypothetical protein